MDICIKSISGGVIHKRTVHHLVGAICEVVVVIIRNGAEPRQLTTFIIIKQGVVDSYAAIPTVNCSTPIVDTNAFKNTSVKSGESTRIQIHTSAISGQPVCFHSMKLRI